MALGPILHKMLRRRCLDRAAPSRSGGGLLQPCPPFRFRRNGGHGLETRATGSAWPRLPAAQNEPTAARTAADHDTRTTMTKRFFIALAVLVLVLSFAFRAA